MKKFILILIWCLGPMIMVTGQEQQAEKLLSKAIYEEEVNGNLQEAIRLYEEIVTKFPEYRSVVAEALYRNGYANEKLGNLKARQYYEKVINNYSDQPELVQLAQIRLSHILKTEKPASVQLAGLGLSKLSKEESEDMFVINLYEKGSSLVKGTMLDNSSLSPDGTKMAGIDYSIGQNVAVYDRKTKEIQLITKYDWSSEGHGYTYFPTWSPDGKKVAYMFAGWKGGYELQVSSLKGETRTLFKNEFNTGQIIPRQWS
ncbi:MAG: tetratricopeptide repeat protein, partial [Bacteroidales bacterium]|nr:tetratricopeptide repeat protein [Bacteroidales bacterium]